MKRSDFLKGICLTGIGTMLPLPKIFADTAGKTTTGCVLIPQETEGPYPFDLSANSAMYRQDITEGNPGIALNLTLTFVNINNSCTPLPNLRIDIWHCNKDGYYSEYANQPGYLGTQSYTGDTFFRGIQMTDYNGQVKFTTIYPGWYTGRVTHIHVNVFLNSVLKATTQLAFPDSLNQTVYATSLYSAHGQNTSVVNNAADNVFSDTSNTQYELLTIAANSSGGYDASLTIGIDVPVTGVINLTPETAGQFVLDQNYPNPFASSTIFSFSLFENSKVWVDIFDMMGKKVSQLEIGNLNAGDHKIEWAGVGKNGARLAPGNYAYQLNVENKNGSHGQVKMLTIE